MFQALSAYRYLSNMVRTTARSELAGMLLRGAPRLLGMLGLVMLCAMLFGMRHPSGHLLLVRCSALKRSSSMLQCPDSLTNFRECTLELMEAQIDSVTLPP